MRQRLALRTPWWSSAEQKDFPARYASAQALASMRIGRFAFYLILKHGKDTPPGLQQLLDDTESRMSELPTSLHFSDQSEPTIANTLRRRRSRYWISRGSMVHISSPNWKAF